MNILYTFYFVCASFVLLFLSLYTSSFKIQQKLCKVSQACRRVDSASDGGRIPHLDGYREALEEERFGSGLSSGKPEAMA